MGQRSWYENVRKPSSAKFISLVKINKKRTLRVWLGCVDRSQICENYNEVSRISTASLNLVPLNYLHSLVPEIEVQQLSG